MKQALVAAALVLVAPLASCSTKPAFNREAEAAAPPTGTIPPRPAEEPRTAGSPPAVPPPTVTEAARAVARVFGSAVTVDARSGQGLVAADLNGDASQDLAVVVRPDPHRLAEINDDLANWIIQDPFAPPAGPGVGVPAPRPDRVRVEAGDSLLAVVPGYGAEGWREEASRHGFLLRNAAGVEMESLPLERLISAGPGRISSEDALQERIGTRRGFIYWTGAKFLWRDAGSPAPRLGR